MPRKSAREAADDPNQLKRRQAGIYRTGDERFEVRSSGVGWMLLDTKETDDFGQPLTRGPFATRDAARAALPEARRATIKPVKRRARD
jgi:hypothetical protein